MHSGRLSNSRESGRNSAAVAVPVGEGEIQLSDFARPRKKPPRAGKGTFGQTIGHHPLVERRIWKYYNKKMRKIEMKIYENISNVK